MLRTTARTAATTAKTSARFFSTMSKPEAQLEETAKSTGISAAKIAFGLTAIGTPLYLHFGDKEIFQSIIDANENESEQKHQPR